MQPTQNMAKGNNQNRSFRDNSDSTDNLVHELLGNAINRNDLPPNQKSFLKRKTNGDLRIIKVVNNLLRSTIVVTFTPSVLNRERTIEVFFKRYRKNTVDQFGQSCRVTSTSSYNLLNIEDTYRLVSDVEKHMAVVPENLKTINEALPIRIGDFTQISEDSLYAFEIHAFDVVPSENPLEGSIELSLVSNQMVKDFTIKISDIVYFNDISDLIGKFVVLNYKGAFKIKNKDEIFSSYNVIETKKK
jgi:hypothetical protein